MNSIAENLLGAFFRIFFRKAPGRFFFWTGELILTILLVGFHRPRWRGYSSSGVLHWVLAESALIFLGFSFWLASFPLIYDFFMQA